MGSRNRLLLFSSFVFVLLNISIECYVLAEDKNGQTVGSLIEENLNLKNTLKKFQAKLEELEGKVESLTKVNSQQSVASKTVSARTCYELVRSDPTAESGMYYIDPDGWNVGDLPIYVFCDKATGETRVLHDSLEKMNVGHCLDPGCYSRPVNYNASMRQMKALKQLSSRCDQYIRYDCLGAVFMFNDVQYAWWNDIHGEPQYYWDGSNGTVHTCSCGITGDCIESNALCNCDVSAPVQLFDEGRITNGNHLPITGLNFGRTPSYASGEHTLGPLRCSGSFKSSSNDVPGSCADLWRGGITFSGLYQVKASDGKILTVFCDMSKLPEETGHQTIIGTSDVKSNLVYFTAVRETTFASVGSTIPYEKTLLNTGNAMNVETGKFTAPNNGIYFFAFTLCSTTNSAASLMHNGALITTAETSSATDWHSATGQATLQLKAGDIVYTQLDLGNAASSTKHETLFTGYLLQEL